MGHPTADYSLAVPLSSEHESDAKMPADVYATHVHFNRNGNNVRPHIPSQHDSFKFFTDSKKPNYFVGDAENSDITHPIPDVADSEKKALVPQSDPKIDLNQIGAGLDLSPGDIQSIITGKSA
jgi:hypothetical protein